MTQNIKKYRIGVLDNQKEDSVQEIINVLKDVATNKKS
jgi:hypothetical protein